MKVPMTIATRHIPPGPGPSPRAARGGPATDRAHRAVRSLAKRAVDLTGSAAGLVLLAPLLLAVAALVRLHSPGPVLFRQRRLGLAGREFVILKFRTMAVDAERRVGELEAKNESDGGVLFKIRDDPRVTGLGRLLRRTSLDELPQLVNVLVGDMSLVGPRPLQLRDSDRLREVDPAGFADRLRVRPGLTGPWQVRGRSDLAGEAMLGLDREYIDRWSIGLDLTILLRTVAVVLAGRGAC